LGNVDPPSQRFPLRFASAYVFFGATRFHFVPSSFDYDVTCLRWLRHGRRVGVASDSKMPERSASRTQRHSYGL